MDKLHVDMDEANSAKATLEIIIKTAKDQVAEFQRQVQALQTHAMESRATANKVTKLERS